MKNSLLAAVVMASLASMANAATIIPVFTKAEARIDGASTVNDGLPTSFAQQTVTGSEFAATVTAFQNQTGFSQLSLDVTSYDANGSFAADAQPHDLFAATYLILNFLNEGTTAEYGFFDFTLSGMSLTSLTAGGDAPTASLDFGIISTGPNAGGSDYFASIGLLGTFDNPTITNANGMSGTLTKTFCFAGPCYGGDLQVDDLSGTVSLGQINPGEYAQLTIFMLGSAQFAGTESGAQVFATDPNGASFLNYNYRSAPVSAVPLPASLMFSLAGLGCLAGLARRRRA